MMLTRVTFTMCYLCIFVNKEDKKDDKIYKKKQYSKQQPTFHFSIRVAVVAKEGWLWLVV